MIGKLLLKSWLIQLSVMVLFLAPVTSRASELLMFERDGCVWCQRWNRDVGVIFDKTDEAKLLPLRRIDIGQQSTSGVMLASAVRFTPTFVIVDEGREIGRITGNINDDAFWGLLGTFVPRLESRRSEHTQLVQPSSGNSNGSQTQ